MPRKSTIDAELDVVWGAAEIGRVINITPRRAFYLLEEGKIPARKIGKLWSARRSTLIAFFDGAVEEAEQRAKRKQA
jgi:hypothetical protein